MSNFTFIPKQWATLAQTTQEAEQHVHNAPLYAAMLCRKSLEEWVRWIYEHDKDLEFPYDTTLSSLIYNEPFKQLIDPIQFNRINLIRKIGNQAVHVKSKISPQEALYSLRLLHGFISWIVLLYSESKSEIKPFDESLVPKEALNEKSRDELLELEKAFLDTQALVKKLQEELDLIKATKEKNKEYTPPPIDPHEDLTRKLYIDILLKEAGWDPVGPNVPEYRVEGMPHADGSTGVGYVDYVLWGDDGKPLAVVESKRTMKDAKVGQQQAFLYANCLEKEFHHRPLIYFSNGFETWFWDDLNYPYRPVFGFHTKDELQSIIYRRSNKKDLHSEPVNHAITDRYYQLESIKACAEAFEKRTREVLLVMATGTGKTRTAASLIDMLNKAGWNKRTLFLADRNALVRQAKNAFNNHLPYLPAIDLTKEKEDDSSRIVFSTYQTLINLIDSEFTGGERFYGIGHFDTVIFDEIHRSVYNKYKVIFKYFDALKIGLTATPSSQGDRDTYELFGLEPHNPTYAYELKQGVDDKYLVDFKAPPVTTKFQRHGIKYDELSEEEKRKFEEEFSDPLTGEFPDEIDATALNEWLFNIDTVDKVIGGIMENGIKVNGGDTLGKTIIFARSHKHAQFIEERFNIQYPQYKGHFLRVIDNYETYAYDLLMKFSNPAEMPQIAVSVDMLDTGIDIPEVVNLVFCKPVRSAIKFWQMIGRGTRISKDLFAPGIDKSQFLIFDFCGNFEFFGVNPSGVERKETKSLSQRIFEIRLKLAVLLRSEADPEQQNYGEELLNLLISQTTSLNQESFIIRQHWRFVEKYRVPGAWSSLSDTDIRDINKHIAPLVENIESDELAKRFDLLMLNLQFYILLTDKRQSNLIDKVKGIGARLTKKSSIPLVAQKMDILLDIQTNDYWKDITLPALEKLRVEIRDLIQFLEKESRPIVYTDFEDEFEGQWVTQEVTGLAYGDLSAYKRRVEKFLKDNQNHLTIQKLKTNLPITKFELKDLEQMLFSQGSLGSKDDLIKAFGDQPLGLFVRSILGLDVNAAKIAFSGFLQGSTLNSQQIRFIDTIIKFLTVKGTIDPGMLFESPFTDLNTNGLTGIFDLPDSQKIIQTINEINENAVAA
jgi:type I restriction enzyme, R subunit